MTTAKRKFHEVDVDVQHDEPLSGSRAARRYIGAGEADIDDSSDEEVERDEAHRSGDDRSDNASGSGSSSDSDSEVLDCNERWGSAPPDQDMRVEAFSMAQELRRGQFNEAGTYVTHDRRGGAYSDDDDDDDSQDEDGDELGAFDGIKPVDKEGMAKAREAQVAQQAIDAVTDSVAVLERRRIVDDIPKTSKSFLSYSAVRNSYTESDYYSRYALHNQPADAHVSNNAGGHVENSERTFVNNSAHSQTSVSDVDETKFVPKVSSDDHVSGSGHNKI
ncbi:hypothetical protein PICMEDRAFT_71942 [Pichia membranifaciens NRRL Y-2026]|uniref:Uncharacterized protein n=1 Tax=Pichia membranifaciens NRRL Y-2026 TaxID=763406 RepID=A0A1E3NPF5_9ASCO|nr:hypothetical protein PICMEDRAFT_71942 [Pichia membranifaciens NRRL Y-2026]ODQ47935.1 hypothetical protein PICMEDRAFT_71942 [Pichia membranifaciens NRRL Y-2026]